MPPVAPKPNSARKLRWTILLAFVALLAVTAGLSYRLLSPRLKRAKFRAEVIQLLKSDKPADRQHGALRAAEKSDPDLNGRLQQAVMGDEPDAAVRATAVASLGSHRSPAWFGAAEHALELDEDGAVRANGWIAAAQMDPDRCKALLTQHPDLTDSWDKLGTTAARLLLDETAAVRPLLDIAEKGDAAQRVIACRMLDSTLRPMLESTGRWPLSAVPPGSLWSKGLLADVRRQCDGLDLDALVRDTNAALASGALAHKLEHRVYNARGRLIPMLFASSDKSE